MYMIEDKDAELIVIVGQTSKVHLFCIVLTHVVTCFPLSVFSQLSLEARGIATKGMQAAWIAWWNGR